MVDLIRKPHDLIIVMERAKTDLQKVLYHEGIPINEEEKRTILNQLFKGLSAIHNNKIIHRDIKPSNVLISFDGIIKITDFGLSVPLERGVKHSLRGGTLFYKAIELLMGDEKYDEKVDMWASGCCMAELWQRKLLFLPACRTVTKQVAAISEYCSFPTEQEWPEVVTYQYYSPLLNLNHHYKENRLVDSAQRITEGESSAADLLTKLLTLNPKDRISSNQALTHEYFTRAPVEPNVENLVKKMNGLKLKSMETSSLH
ncbi:cyclin-dependent kinase 9-like [Nilaparvata lugens]|uniref:cyclin-dependent kinase 9-like n=1 Tax=Nilaparvata lugens TaxID=108931 RepID=UPI00193D09AC|nr:cyclin-dependent kinase 9-like [Nilaparvata lugens]